MPKKHRSPAYPAIDLKEAVKLGRKIYPAATHAIGGDVIAVEWGYKSLASATSYLAALKQYGLLIEERGGSDRLFKLSEAALDIAVDENEESAVCRDAIKAASIKPNIHKELFDKWGSRFPPDAEIRRYLERERAFNPKHVSRFVRIYKSTILYANSFNSSGSRVAPGVDTPNNGNGKDPPPVVRVGSYIQWTSQGVDQFPAPLPVEGVSDDGRWVFVEGSQTGVPMSELTVQEAPDSAQDQSLGGPPINPFYKPKSEEPQAGTALDRTTLDEGPVRLEWPDDLCQESVEEFQYWVVGRINRVRRKAGLNKITLQEEKTSQKS